MFEPSYGPALIKKDFQNIIGWCEEKGYHDGGIFSDKNEMEASPQKKLMSDANSNIGGFDLPPQNFLKPVEMVNSEPQMEKSFKRITSKQFQITFWCNEPQMKNLTDLDKKNFLKIFYENLQKSYLFKKNSIKKYLFGFKDVRVQQELLNKCKMYAKCMQIKNIV